MKHFLLLILLFFGIQMLYGQIIGGQNVYESLNLSPSARISALGGSLIAVKDDDISLAFQNPAALNPEMDQVLSFNHRFHLAGINHGYFGYAKHFDTLQMTFHGGIQYVSYGEFENVNEFQQELGTFNANEYVLTLGASRMVYENLSVGANLKLITSQFEGFNSFGFGVDLGATFYKEEKRFGATLLLKNIGTQITTYTDDNREPIPFEIQVGISKRLEHLPFRLSIIATNLQQWNLLYDDPDMEEEETLLFGDIDSPSDDPFGDWVDNFFRHFVFSGEFLFGKKDNVQLRFAYNHLRRMELSTRNLRGMTGFSMGFGIKISKFRLDYGHTFFHRAGGLNHIGISTNINAFKTGLQ